MNSNSLDYTRAVDHKRLDFIIDQLSQYVLGNGSILDVGCGNGIMSKAIGAHGYKVLGIDISDKAIEKANRFSPPSNVSFKVLSANELVADGNTYDAIICSEVLEHLDNPGALLQTLYKLLTDTGILIVTVPNGLGPREVLITKPMQKVQREDGRLLSIIEWVKNKLGYDGTTEQSDADDLTHIQFFSKRSLGSLLSANNFKLAKFQHANFLADVFPVSFLANRSYHLQKLDCRLADFLPHNFTCGFYSTWTKVKNQKL
jgi:SAM-dependent methyltransferase